MPDYSGRPGSIGEPIHEVLFRAKQRKAAGDQLILWTCREGKALSEAVEICRLHGLTFDAVNQNLPGRCRTGAWPDSRKVHADEYWDDKAVRIEDPAVSWTREQLQGKPGYRLETVPGPPVVVAGHVLPGWPREAAVYREPDRRPLGLDGVDDTLGAIVDRASREGWVPEQGGVSQELARIDRHGLPDV